MSLADRFSARLKNNDTPALAFISRRCLRSRFQDSACARCVGECPAQAIQAERGKIHLDSKRCIGCLACTAVCPTEALTSPDPRLASATAKAKGQTHLVFCCEKSIRSGEEIVLPCLGALSAEQLAAYTATATDGLRLNLAKCSDCRAAAVPDILDQRLYQLEGTMGSNTIPASIRLVYRQEEDENRAESSSRRAFFKAFSQLSFHAAAETMTALKADPGRKERASDKHLPARLVQLRQSVEQCTDSGIKEALLRLFYGLQVSEACNFCGGCAGMCPTGALKNTREEEIKQLKFDWAKCSGCGLCLDFCRKQALTLSPGRDPDALTIELEVLREMVVE